MMIEVTKLQPTPRQKITLHIDNIMLVAHSKLVSGAAIQLRDNRVIHVFEWYRIIQWLMSRTDRKKIVSYSQERDKPEFEAWRVEYMGDKKSKWLQDWDDRDQPINTEPEAEQILPDGLVLYADGSKGIPGVDKGTLFHQPVVILDEDDGLAHLRKVSDLPSVFAKKHDAQQLNLMDLSDLDLL